MRPSDSDQPPEDTPQPQPLAYATKETAPSRHWSALALAQGSLSLAAVWLGALWFGVCFVSPYVHLLLGTAVLSAMLGAAAVRNVRYPDRERAIAWLSALIGLGLSLYSAIGLIYEWRNSPPPDWRVRYDCASQMQCLGGALVQSAQAQGGRFPTTFAAIPGASAWGPDDLSCPASWLSAKRSDYVYWGAALTAPCNAKTVLLTESLQNHNGKGMNVCFADGTVKFIDAKSAKKLLAELEAGHNPPRNWP